MADFVKEAKPAKQPFSRAWKPDFACAGAILKPGLPFGECAKIKPVLQRFYLAPAPRKKGLPPSGRGSLKRADSRESWLPPPGV